MKTMPAAKFKAQCLSVLDDVNKKKERIVVTKHGKPVAQIVPCRTAATTTSNPLKGSVIYEGDIISSTGEAWEADS
jgi:prevent-host-death family protein